uniref:SERPIN domain-containing protein n=1 Tax=Meloidogyne hapla TaxID=6305 RepID=A0A1I8BYC8_MELHA
MSDIAIIKAQADFAIDLLNNVVYENNKPVESTILSPLSLSMALAMVYVGADGETNKELGKLLSEGLKEEETHKYFGKLFNNYNDNKPKNYTLELANKVFVKEGFKILEEFKKFINENYGGKFELLDFSKSVEAAKIINDFVEQTTHDKIKNLISPDSLNQDTRQVDMMKKTDYFVYFEDKELQMLKMFYSGSSSEEEEDEDIYMVVFLPQERFGLQKMIKNLNGEKVLKLLESGRKTKVDVLFPKFKLESTHNLNEVLIKLGLTTAFGNQANFSKISKEQPLQIDKVVQKAFIEVNEEGTEAAAATAVILETRSMVINVESIQFKADHPFYYAIMKNNEKNGHEFSFAGVFYG